MWDLLHNEVAVARVWREHELLTVDYLGELRCEFCQMCHAPATDPEDCPTLEGERELVETHGAAIVRMARAVLEDARCYRKPKRRPRWSPAYNGLVENVLALEPAFRRALEDQARDDARVREKIREAHGDPDMAVTF